MSVGRARLRSRAASGRRLSRCAWACSCCLTVALPGIQRGLGASLSGLKWIVDAYALTLAAFLLTAVSLSDMYGRRLMFLIGLAVFAGHRNCGLTPEAKRTERRRASSADWDDMCAAMRRTSVIALRTESAVFNCSSQ